jgi:catechol 2,3-dioxygenase-like lactoylglutathione lyase family enzyme
MTIRRMDHVGIVVDDLADAVAFFVELGLELQGDGPVEGGWVDRMVRWRGGALPGHLSALLRPRPRGNHRRAGGADRLTGQPRRLALTSPSVFGKSSKITLGLLVPPHS